MTSRSLRTMVLLFPISSYNLSYKYVTETKLYRKTKNILLIYDIDYNKYVHKINFLNIE